MLSEPSKAVEASSSAAAATAPVNVDALLEGLESVDLNPENTYQDAGPEPLIEITFCRYENNKLVKQKRDPSSLDFVAISHVWGDAAWQKLDCIDEEILVSREKAKFIAERLPSLMTDQWLWMDVLCVDQRDADARVAVTQHIPLIFRLAKKTIVVKGNSGLQDCCVKAAGSVWSFWGKSNYATSEDDDLDDRDEDPDGRMLLRAHLHRNHQGEIIDEGVLTRLWPLQEINLSNTIQFVQAEKLEDDTDSPTAIMLRSQNNGALASNLSTLATTWSTYGTGGDDHTWYRLGRDKYLFLSAFFDNGTVNRGGREGRQTHEPRAQDILMHITSTRHTSKARDFVLAIFPQFDFYKVPPNARKMTFSQLFVDCCRQLRDIDNRIAPLLIRSSNLLDGRIESSQIEIPEPTCLGDMVKLFNGPVLRTPRGGAAFLDMVKPHPISAIMEQPPPGHDEMPADPELIQLGHFVQTVHIIVRSIFNSTVLWLTISEELDHELSVLLSKHDDALQDRICALQGLGTVLQRIDFSSDSYQNAVRLTQVRQVQDLIFPVPWEITILYLAMASCGLGLSAYEWAKANLVPMVMTINRVSHIALIRKQIVTPTTIYVMKEADDFLLGRDGPMGRMCLLAIHSRRDDEEGDEATKNDIMHQCLFPPDSKFKASRKY